jgi:hypothetical protein
MCSQRRAVGRAMKALVSAPKLERVAVRCPIVLARSGGRTAATATNRLLTAASNGLGGFCRLILPAITCAVPAELLPPQYSHGVAHHGLIVLAGLVYRAPAWWWGRGNGDRSQASQRPGTCSPLSSQGERCCHFWVRAGAHYAVAIVACSRITSARA